MIVFLTDNIFVEFGDVVIIRQYCHVVPKTHDPDPIQEAQEALSRSPEKHV